MNKSIFESRLFHLYMTGTMLALVVLVGMASFFLGSSHSSGFKTPMLIIILSIMIGIFVIGMYAQKKFPQKNRPLWAFVTSMIISTLILGFIGYRLTIEPSNYNFFLFILLFCSLIYSFRKYMKERKTAGMLPNNKKEVL